MISTPTSLILGAGASKPFGFPTGNELAELLTTRLIVQCNPNYLPLFGNSYAPIDIEYPNYSPNPWELLFHLGFSSEDCSEFAHEFSTSNLASIDLFLGKNGHRLLPSRKTFLDLGKKAVTGIISVYEGQERLMPRGNQNWYHEFFTQLEMYRFSDFIKAATYIRKMLSVVNFNYDRSFDFALFKHIKGVFPVDDEQAYSLVQSIVYHPYGSLGPIVGEKHVPYETISTRASPPKIIERIHQSSAYVHFIRGGERVSDFVTKALFASNKVYFLGFGFHQENVDVLGENFVSQFEGHSNLVSTRIDKKPKLYWAQKNFRLLKISGYCDTVFLDFPL